MLKVQSLDDFLRGVAARDPQQPEFMQAVQEVMLSLWPFIESTTTPSTPSRAPGGAERVIQFRVCWTDDQGQARVNRAFRIQHSSAIGLQGGRCELYRHLGPDNRRVPAGDIGRARVKWLHGRHDEEAVQLHRQRVHRQGPDLRRQPDPPRSHRLRHRFAEEMLKRIGRSFDGLRVSGPARGNVAQYAIERPWRWAPKVVTVSDSNGTVVDEAGFTHEKLLALMRIKNDLRGRLDAYASQFGLSTKPASVPGTCRSTWPALRHAEQAGTGRRPDADQERRAVRGRGREHARHAGSGQGLHRRARAVRAGQASNAGGVAVSGLEMSQNAARLAWTREEVDARLRHHARHPRELRAPRPQRARVRELPGRRQHRRLRQGGRRDASARAVLEGPPGASGASLNGPPQGGATADRSIEPTPEALRFFPQGATADRQSRLRVAPVGRTCRMGRVRQCSGSVQRV